MRGKENFHVFPRDQYIYTVIHASDPDQVYRNVERTIAAGADGCFLINHAGIAVNTLLETLAHAKTNYTTRQQRPYFGLNLLGVNELDVFKMADDYGADGLWIDESYVRAGTEMDDMLDAMDVAMEAFHGEYYAGVAFKTQGHCPDPAAVAKKAMNHCDVICTSGPDTGMAPDVSKIQAMKAAIEDKPLAIASGITPENIHLFPMASAILVASGVQDSWTELNTKRIELLVKNKTRVNSAG